MDTAQLHTTAIIIGAGPGGAATSLNLSKLHIPHIIIDKATFPRDKVCGDCCGLKTNEVIRRLNPDWLTELQLDVKHQLPSWGLTIYAPNGKALAIPFPPEGVPADNALIFNMPRLDFDDFLFRKLPSPYCQVFQGAQVTGINKEGGQVTVNFTVGSKSYEATAPVIIGADGEKSIVKKELDTDTQFPKANAVGLRAYYEGIAGCTPGNNIELHFMRELLPGYFWIFPLANGRANVGVGIMSDLIRARKLNLKEKMLAAIQHNPALAPRFKNAKLQGKILGWGLPMALHRRSICGDRYMLVGDAASLVDPFTGEGIGNAMYSGMLAAEVIQKAQEKGDFSTAFFKTHYETDLYARLGDEFRISAAMQKLSNYPWLTNMVVNKGNKSAALRTTISQMFSNLELRDDLKKPSFYFKILMNR